MTALRSYAERLLDHGLATAVIAVLDRDGEQERVAIGAPHDAIVRIQSMTKAVIAAATMRLVETGDLALDHPVDEWAPELTGLQVLRTPVSAVDDTVPAAGPITFRHLLTCTSGYGMEPSPTPVAEAFRDAGLETGSARSPYDAEEWLSRLCRLPLTFQPGGGWRYHTSFSILGVLLERLVGLPLEQHLRTAVFEPLGMTDTGYWVPPADADRLVPAHQYVDGGLRPLDVGSFVGPATRAMSHGELVSTLKDYLRFARMLRDGGLLDSTSVAAMTSGQVDDAIKTDADFVSPTFWRNVDWGFGLAIEKGRRRYGWTGGLGTDFLVDSDTSTIGIVLTQTELGAGTSAIVEDFEELV